jgi:hypothetical protein
MMPRKWIRGLIIACPHMAKMVGIDNFCNGSLI